MKEKFTTTKELHKLFPKIAASPSSAKSTSPIDRYYNCVAWALGDQSSWWEPFVGTFPLTHWPIERRGYGIQHYVEMFISQGFAVCDGPTQENGFDKIVLYVDANGKFLHVSKQTVDPKPGWGSKCGQKSDIWHATPELLEGADYGTVWGYLQRPSPDALAPAMRT